MKTLLLFALLCISLISSAQEPSYYTFGVDQFKGVDIYDVIQDSELNYWFATDQGVVLHDGYTYQKKSCLNMKGSSVFGFVKDSKGTIYCYNLHQQIFRIRNGEIEFYYQIPEKLEHHELHLRVDSKDKLFIQSKGIISITPNKKKIEIIESLLTDANPINFHLLPDGSTITAFSDTRLIHQKDGKLEIYEIPQQSSGNQATLDGSFLWFDIDDRVYAIEHRDLEVFELNQENFSFKFVAQLDAAITNQRIRLEYTSDRIWLSGIGNGTYVFSNNFEPLFNGNRIFSSAFLSDFFTDAEGNILLSTFADGVRVIPNLDVQGHALPLTEKIVHIESDGRNSLFLSTNRGNIYQFKDGEHNLLYSDPAQKSNEGMKYWPEQKMLVFYTSKSAQFRSWNGEKLTFVDEVLGAFKNANFSSATNGVVAFNYGVLSVEAKSDGSLQFFKIPELEKRSYCVVRDEITQTIYAGLSNGLVRHHPSGKTELIQYKGRAVYPNALLYHDGKTYVGTRSYGVLVYKNDQLQSEIPYDDVVKKMVIYKDELFILSNHGLDISSLNGENIKQLNNASGLSFEYVSDFHVTNNTLYISDSKSVQFVSLDQLFKEAEEVPIHFKWVRVNNKLTTNTSFDYTQRKVQFGFGVSTLQFRENILYRYKLEGYDTEWQFNTYEDNQVTYNALSPGKYTFVVQCLNDETKSKPIRYSFTIDAPFHQKWWFYLLIFLASGLLMTLFFFYRIRSIRKKNKARLEKQKTQTDLLEYELKALRSQMNPHFIFNSLNSIQDLILKEETDASYDYIVLFADLVRSTLNHSNKDFIEIEKEIEFIKVYLSLEQLRFKEDFEYTIDANGISDIKLPTLLIQPFIENALIHGLIHKEGLKRLEIEFNLNENKLTCSIRDNGIGREKAKEIKERQGGHDSFALNAIEKRLSILNRHIEYECGFIFNDLEKDGKAVGTEVIVTLPYKQLY